MKAVDGQVDGLADTHAGMAKEQKDIGGQIIAAEQFLLHSFILFDRERAWQTFGATRSVFAMQQPGEFGNLCGPGEALQDPAKDQNANEKGTNGERRLVRTQMSQPTEDVRITPQLFQGMDLGIFVTEIKEEVANDTAILTSRSWTECASDIKLSPNPLLIKTVRDIAACISTRPITRWCSASTQRARFKRSTGRSRCPCSRGNWSVTRIPEHIADTMQISHD
jgi:hypothetical protein